MIGRVSSTPWDQIAAATVDPQTPEYNPAPLVPYMKAQWVRHKAGAATHTRDGLVTQTPVRGPWRRVPPSSEAHHRDGQDTHKPKEAP